MYREFKIISLLNIYFKNIETIISLYSVSLFVTL